MEVRASILDKLCENIVENKYENLNDIMANFRIIRDAEIANFSKEYMEQYELYENTNKAILKFERLYDYIEEHGSEELLGKLNKVEEVLNEIENSATKNTIIEKINNFSFGDENFSPENLEIDFNNINLHAQGLSIFPYMFITVGCGAISGFHATQTPMVSKCIVSEKEGINAQDQFIAKLLKTKAKKKNEKQFGKDSSLFNLSIKSFP